MFSWFSLTLLSVIFLATYYFLSKRLLNEEQAVDPRLYGAVLQFSTGLVALPVAVLSGFSFDLTPLSAGLLLVMALVYSVGPSLYYVGLKHVELSETTVLDSSGVLWTLLLGSLVLRESFTWEKVAGVLLILVAILVVSYRKSSQTLKFSKYQWFLVASPFFYSLGAILDNRLVSYSNAASYLPISFLLAGTFMMLSNVSRLKKVGKQTLSNRGFWRVIGMNAIFIFLTYFCVMKAYELGGEVSRMYPIQQSESVVVPLLAIFLLKEKERLGQKLLAALIAFGGLLLLRV